YSATTIAKDLKELNIYRVPIDCETWIYKAINNQTEQEMREKFKHYCEHEVLSSIINGAYIIVKTSPGFAQGINYFIDQLNIEEILGTVSGNDTTLILTASNDMAEYVYAKLFK
ncbi:TPA: ArgR family transcriptional regulator, partial [Staphylococcus aureus]|nr:ArgR family transcriptional regulator [Staphylococcus aureus]